MDVVLFGRMLYNKGNLIFRKRANGYEHKTNFKNP